MDEVQAFEQSTRVHISRVHNNLHEYVCMSVTYVHAKPGFHTSWHVYEL